MDSGNSESLQSSSDDYESSYTGAATDHSSLFLPPPVQEPFSSTFYGGQTTTSSSNTYLNFVNNLISNEMLNQTHLLPTTPPPPSPLPSSSRNPRKRTRASKKPTTTVLSTDTSNFRAMVQEFTGVPASPFSLPFPSTTRRFRSPYDRPNPQMFHQPLFPSSSSSFLNQYHSINFPDLPLLQNHQVSTFQSLSSHQTTFSSLHDLESMNLEALHQNHHPTADVDHDHHELMMRQFSGFEHRTDKRPETLDNIASTSSPLIKDSSATITTTTTDELWILPTDPNN